MVFDSITTRSANENDLETLYRFEQGIVATERPFDATLKDGEIHYYDLKAMITAPDVELAVAVDGDKVVGSGYARITTSKVYLEHRQHVYLGLCMWNRNIAAGVLTKRSSII